ncbi:PREDICTED: uncharacterized protein LOC104462986 [Pterocles gutturalis]|nr:PREDICTED: uncharacterized protein LOC104462986 [Pterocles gutturalis]
MRQPWLQQLDDCKVEDPERSEQAEEEDDNPGLQKGRFGLLGFPQEAALEGRGPSRAGLAVRVPSSPSLLADSVGMKQYPTVKEGRVKNHLGQLNIDESMGPGRMCPSVLKGLGDVTAELFPSIFKRPWQLGEVSSDWKKANITHPVLRKGKEEDAAKSPQKANLSRGKSSRTITFEQFKEALQELSKKRFKDKSDEEAVQEIYKLIEGKAPIISGVTKAISSPTVSRLTDTTKFTGSHKERFDPSGKGKGKAGREDLVDDSGYVSGYKHAGTYDHKVQGSK